MGLTFNVDLVEPLGSDQLLHGRLGSRVEDTVVRLKDGQVAIAGPLTLYSEQERFLFFDPSTGERIRG